MNVYYNLTGSVSENSVNGMISSLSSKVIDANYSETIVIYISNIGGDVDSAVRAYDYLKNLKNKIITVGYSQVDSSAIPIFLAGAERIVYKNTRIRLHEATYNIGLERASLSTFQERVRFFEELERRTREIYIQESNIDEKTMKKIRERGKIIDAEEAVRLGIAHKVSGNIPNLNDL